MITFHRRGVSFVRLFGIGLICLFACGEWTAAAADTNTPAGLIENNYREAKKQFNAANTNPVLAWQFGRACFDMAGLQKESSAEASFAQEGIDACRRSLNLAPGSAAAHYYLGMLIGQLADTKHNLSALRMVKDMEREWLAALALNKNFDYAGPDRNLGLLYRDAPVIASIGSRSKSRQHLEAAVELAPGFPENQLNLLEVYLKWDYHNEALRQFGELEKIWPEAKKKFVGIDWALSWADWNKRLDAIKKKLEQNPKTESPKAQ